MDYDDITLYHTHHLPFNRTWDNRGLRVSLCVDHESKYSEFFKKRHRTWIVKTIIKRKELV